jgi:hypothetical protein
VFKQRKKHDGSRPPDRIGDPARANSSARFAVPRQNSKRAASAHETGFHARKLSVLDWRMEKVFEIFDETSSQKMYR